MDVQVYSQSDLTTLMEIVKPPQAFGPAFDGAEVSPKKWTHT